MINGGPATDNQVRDREKELKQKLLEMKSSIQDILLSNLSDERSARLFQASEFEVNTLRTLIQAYTYPGIHLSRCMGATDGFSKAS